MTPASSAPAFVTGGSGFVGGAVVRHLVADGRLVRALARSSKAEARVAELGAVPVAGSLDDADAMVDGMRGCSAVFHVAGVNSMCARDPSPMFRVNVDGVAAVLHAAAEAGVPRVIHTSSSVAIGERHEQIGREDSPHRGRFLSEYERSKFLGEALARRLGPELGLDVVCVNPSSVQGPERETGTAKLLLAVAGAWTAVLVRTWFSIVDVDDSARGHLLAERHGVAGDRYLLSGAAMSTEEAVELLRRELGSPRRVVWIPRTSVRLATPATAITARLDGPQPTLCPALLRSLLHGHRYDGSRATRTLGLEYRPVEDTLRRVVAWYRDRGLLRQRDPA